MNFFILSLSQYRVSCGKSSQYGSSGFLSNFVTFCFLLFVATLLVSCCYKKNLDTYNDKTKLLNPPTKPKGVFYKASEKREKPYVQLTWDYSVSKYFNIYRSADVKGPWEKINKGLHLQESHAFVDYNMPANVKALYYRITSLNDKGNESKPSEIEKVDINP